MGRIKTAPNGIEYMHRFRNPDDSRFQDYYQLETTNNWKLNHKSDIYAYFDSGDSPAAILNKVVWWESQTGIELETEDIEAIFYNAKLAERYR